MSNFAQIAKRVEEGIKNGDDLFVDMVSLMPEICAPHIRESDGKPDIGCVTMLTLIGKTALMVECGAVTAEEALAEVAVLNTCDDCPLKTFD